MYCDHNYSYNIDFMYAITIAIIIDFICVITIAIIIDFIYVCVSLYMYAFMCKTIPV